MMTDDRPFLGGWILSIFIDIRYIDMNIYLYTYIKNYTYIRIPICLISERGAAGRGLSTVIIVINC